MSNFPNDVPLAEPLVAELLVERKASFMPVPFEKLIGYVVALI